MLTVAVLLILAVLLFGSSVVLGAIGWLLGLVAAAAALVWASVSLGVDTGTLLLIAGAGFAVLLAIGAYANTRIAEDKKRVDDALAKMTPEGRKAYEDMKRRVRSSRQGTA